MSQPWPRPRDTRKTLSSLSVTWFPFLVSVLLGSDRDKSGPTWGLSTVSSGMVIQDPEEREQARVFVNHGL